MKITDILGLDDLKDKPALLKALLAEIIGTLFLVLVGCGSCAHAKGDFVQIAFCFGITVATMAQSIGHISGCHINPAVTAGLIVGRKVGLIKGLLYIVVQCVGALIGAGLLQVTTGMKAVGITMVSEDIDSGQAFGIEFLITFVLVLVVFAAAADENNSGSVKGSAPLAIGLSITTCHLFAIPFTGSSMNPARSFGPAAVGSVWENHWVYWLGPILGGITAAMVYQLCFTAPVPKLEPKRTYDPVPAKDEEANE